jgi:hypothetical protein
MERLFIFLFALTLTICGAVWGLKRWRLRRNGVRTMGVVVGLSRNGVVRPYLTPIVEFKTDAGDAVKFRGSTGQRGVSPYQQGQHVKVIYLRQDPWNAQIDNFEQFWLGPVGVGFFGLIVLGALLFSQIRTREDAPGSYWAIGLMVFFGVLLTAVAASEYRFYRLTKSHRKDGKSGADLLTRIDDACRLYPEGRETLLRLRTAVVNLEDGVLDSAVTYFLDQVLRAHDREDALKEIQNLAKALDMVGKS